MVALTVVIPVDSNVFSMVRQFSIKKRGLSGKDPRTLSERTGGTLNGGAGRQAEVVVLGGGSRRFLN